jgi:hypothetical protein
VTGDAVGSLTDHCRKMKSTTKAVPNNRTPKAVGVSSSRLYSALLRAHQQSHKFRERGLPAYSWQGNFASCVALRAARSPV